MIRHPVSACLSFVSLLFAFPALAAEDAAGLDGPGVPLETTPSMVLPEGKTLLLFKLDEARYNAYDWNAPNNTRYARATVLGMGYGVTPWFSAFAFLPYNQKVNESSALTSQGGGDVAVVGQVGFRYHRGFHLLAREERPEERMDWRFSVLAGVTLPTGEADYRLGNGTIDPGKSPGLGKPSYTLGITATKLLTDKLTLALEASTQHFQEYAYADGQRKQPGAKSHFNAALTYRAWTVPEQSFRLDPVFEVQYLSAARDRVNGADAFASGGQVVYAMPGVRAYWKNMSFAVGLKKPVWTRLNEGYRQQDSDGKERYRITFSAMLFF